MSTLLINFWLSSYPYLLETHFEGPVSDLCHNTKRRNRYQYSSLLNAKTLLRDNWACGMPVSNLCPCLSIFISHWDHKPKGVYLVCCRQNQSHIQASWDTTTGLTNFNITFMKPGKALQFDGCSFREQVDWRDPTLYWHGVSIVGYCGSVFLCHCTRCYNCDIDRCFSGNSWGVGERFWVMWR